MADGAVNFLLDKLTTILVQEASLLGDVQSDIEAIRDEYESMKSFIKDAERKERSEPIQTWVRQVREVAYEVEGIIDEFLYNKEVGDATRKGYKGFLQDIVYLPKKVATRRQITLKLQKIKAKVREISERSKRYGFNVETGEIGSDVWQHRRSYGHGQSSILTDEDDIVGVDANAEKLHQWLTEDEPRRTVTSVVGMGGLGKTTLVTKVYNDHRIKYDFSCWAWISVSQAYGYKDLLRSIVKELFETKQVNVPSALGTMNSMELLKLIFNFLHQKRYVIILDDVWSIDLWNDIRSAFPNNQNGSRIVLTTRNENVPASVGIGSRIYRLDPLGDDDALALFCKKAFWNDPNHTCPIELQALTTSIIKKCEGLPLAILAIGGLMSLKKKNVIEWKMVYESLNWQLSYNPVLERVKAILLLSFKDLPFYLKHCFLYCCVFRDGHPIKRKKLFRLWVAEGFILERKGMTMEEVAEDYLTELILRNMIQVIQTNDGGRVKTCRVHDVMRELAMTKSHEENFCTAYDGRESTVVQGKTRSLSLYNSGKNVTLSRGISNHLRSFFLFETDTCFSFSLNLFSSKFKFLRVLELEGTFIETLPSSIVDLFNLRYLNVRETKLKKLPKSMERLINLQTLDIRNTNVKRVSNEISKLQKLRHLYMYTETSNLVCSMQAPKGIWNVQGLQTLACVDAEEELIRHIQNLTELKRLEIAKIKVIHGPPLCTSIEMMKSLLHLRLNAISDAEELRLESLSRPPLFLQKLALTGKLNSIPPWIQSLANLTHLYLGSSRLNDGNLLSSLHLLSNLVLLELNNAYNGTVLQFNAEWFPRLNKLNLLELPQLSIVKFEENTLPNIKELHLLHCPQLKALPEGIQHLTSLQKLHLEEMPQDFVQKLKIHTSGDLQVVLHGIPIINLVHLTGQNRVVEIL